MDELQNQPTGPDRDLALAMALKYVENISEQLLADFPEIVDLRLQGVTINQIVEKIDWARYGTNSDRVRYSSVQLALSKAIPENVRAEIAAENYRRIGEINRDTRIGIFDPGHFPLLQEVRRRNGERNRDEGKGIFSLSRDELIAIGEQVFAEGKGIFGLSEEEMQKIRSQGGQASKEKGVGVHGLTHEELIELGRKGGESSRDQGVGVHALSKEELSAQGRKTYEMGIGVHGLSSEERVEVGKDTVRRKLGVHALSKEELSAAGKLRALSIGRIPWYMDENVDTVSGLQEGDYCLALAAKPEYQFDSGSNEGKADSQLIADTLNSVFHGGKEVRNAAGVKNFLYRERKKRR